MSNNILISKSLWLGVGAGVGVIVIGGVFTLGAVYGPNLTARFNSKSSAALSASASAAQNITVADPDVGKLAEAVVPAGGIVLPVKWGDLGKKLVVEGVIDRERFGALYANRLGFGPDEQKLLDGADNGQLKITPDNAGVLLNILWALGLGNKNPILEVGPMQKAEYGGAGNFASTGGWTLAKGDAMGHYSKHAFIKLTNSQQVLVEKVSQNIYRPCCNNSTYFPDCNHGMAMLGLLELMASQGASEAEMYKVALQVNAYWFTDTYLTIAKYYAGKGVAWNNVDPREALSANMSSASGYRALKAQVQPAQSGAGGAGCGV